MKTRGISFLEKSKVKFTVHEYDHEIKGAEFAGESTGIELERMIKTLVACDDRGKTFYFILMPGHVSSDMKKIAKVTGNKRMRMAKVEEAEKLTGYLVGGISPFGSTKKLKVFADESLEQFKKVGINGGGRGVIVQLDFSEICRLLNVTVGDMKRD